MWEYNYSDRNDWLEHGLLGRARANHKYIKRNFIGGKWVYTYAEDLKNKAANKALSTAAGLKTGVGAAVKSYQARDAANNLIGRESNLKTVVNSVKDGVKVAKGTSKVANKALDTADKIDKATKKVDKTTKDTVKKNDIKDDIKTTLVKTKKTIDKAEDNMRYNKAYNTLQKKAVAEAEKKAIDLGNGKKIMSIPMVSMKDIDKEYSKLSKEKHTSDKVIDTVKQIKIGSTLKKKKKKK